MGALDFPNPMTSNLAGYSGCNEWRP